MNFNAGQQDAILCESNLVVLAPPGSGKTGLLIAKCAHILHQHPSSKLALLTFTNAAAQELTHRLTAEVGARLLKERVMVATFHSHCMELLRRANKLGKVISPDETPGILRQAMAACSYDGKYEEAAAELEQHKRDLAFRGDETPLVSAYENIRRRHRAIDFADVIRLAVRGLLDGTISPLPATHILGDEWQDSDEIQNEFIIAHAAAGAITTIVGDDDQSIYSFRGSLGYRGMMDFRSRTSARAIVLEVNYRSHSEILEAAAAVIRNNVERVDKVVASHRKAGGSVQALRAPNRAREAKIVCDMIIADVQRGDDDQVVPPRGRWAIIGRTNNDFRLIEGQLKAEGIAYHRLNGREALPDDAQVFMGFLRTLQTGDSLGLETALQRCPIDPTATAGLMQHFGDQPYRFLDGEMPELDRPLPEDLKFLKEMCRLCQNWRNLLAAGQYERVIDAVADWFMHFGLVLSKTPNEDFSFWVGLLKRGRGSLVRRTDLLLRPRDPKNPTGVALVTMHSSKGLEFENVIIVQVNTGAVPSPKNPSVEEERRLFFVAITRAKNNLTVIGHTTPGPSPFIAEMAKASSVVLGGMAS